MENKIHFIIGMWRSGTTLLREILGMSTDVKIFPEHFVLLNHLKGASSFTDDFKSKMLQDISVNPDFIHFAKPNLKQLKSEFKATKTFEEAIKTTYKACLSEFENPNIFLDKNPIYSYYLNELLSLFPNSKFIWLVREPKDNCISRAKHNIQSYKNYGYLAEWWNLTNELILEKAKQFPNRFLLIHYDEMVVNPEQWVKKITNFIGIEYAAEMLAFESKKEKRITDFVLAAKARDGEISEEYAQRKKAMWENLQKPINNSKTKQWETELNKKDIETVNCISQDFYNSLLSSDFDFSPKKHLLYNSLAKLSLAKLKWDIQRKALN